MNISRSKICMMRKPLGWQEVITGQCPETKRESVNYQLEERFYWHRASQTINNERTTVIVGDCIIKNVQGIKLAKTVGQRVVIKPFPEPQFATCVCIYIVPTIDKSPHQICLHVGTNDLKSSTPSDVADAIIDLASERGWECFRVWNSYIWTNCKDADYCDAVKAVNKRLKQFCNQNNWKLISYANNSSKGLNKGVLHLNREGNELLQKNFVNFMRSNWFPNSNSSFSKVARISRQRSSFG